MQLSAEELERYRRTAHMRWQAQQQRSEARHATAWELARQAAALLKREYGVRRVVAFGSLVHPGRFAEHSDVDLAAWGLTSTNWLRAISAVLGLSREIDLNLVDVTCCSPELLAAIERDGVAL